MMFRCDTSGRRPLPANDRFPKTKQRQRKLVRIPRERFPWKCVENYRILSHGGQKGGWKTASWLISGGFRHMTCDWTSGGTQRCWLAGTDLEMLVNIRERNHTWDLYSTQMWDQTLRCVSSTLRKIGTKALTRIGLFQKVHFCTLFTYKYFKVPLKWLKCTF